MVAALAVLPVGVLMRTITVSTDLYDYNVGSDSSMDFT